LNGKIKESQEHTHTHTEVKAQNKRRQKHGKGGKNFRVTAPKIQKKINRTSNYLYDTMHFTYNNFPAFLFWVVFLSLLCICWRHSPCKLCKCVRSVGGVYKYLTIPRGWLHRPELCPSEWNSP